MAALPNQTSRDLVKRRLEGYSNEEIAQELGVSVHAVRRKLRESCNLKGERSWFGLILFPELLSCASACWRTYMTTLNGFPVP